MTSIIVPEHLKDKVNAVKSRILFLSPSVISGEEREAKKEDFESMSNSNIGSGGFGKVYKVKHRVSQNVYAIKVISKAKILEADLTEQMRLEVKIMYKLEHPNIIKLYNHFEDDDSFYLILELAPKGQLYTKLKKLGRLEERVAAQYIREVAAAVDYLHALKPPIIHRDIKPENILLDDNEIGKLCDFGWSNFFNQDHKRMTYCGTPEYLAPEMIKQAGHDESLDMWNIGVLAFELLTGRPPFEGSAQTELYENIVKVKINFPKDFPKLAKDLVLRLLKSDPKERIHTKELAEHAWFRSNVPLRTIPKKLGEIATSADGEMKYEAVSKKSLVNSPKPEVKKVLLKDTPRIVANKEEKAKMIGELSKQYQSLAKELAELRIASQMKTKELDVARKENAEIKAQFTNSEKGFVPESTLELRRLTDEVQKLRILNKDRTEVIGELEKRNIQISDQETKMKLLQNEIEIEINAKEMLSAKATEWLERVETMGKKYTTLKQTHEEKQKQREIKEAELESKLELMQKKINTKTEEGACEDTEGMTEVIKSVLDGIKSKIKVQINGRKEEEGVRQELLTTYNKFVGIKSKHDNEIHEFLAQYTKKIEDLKLKASEQQNAVLKKREESIEIISKKREEIESKAAEREAGVDRVKNLENMVELQKRLVSDFRELTEMQIREKEELKENINSLKIKLGDLEYQYTQAKNKGSKAKSEASSKMPPAAKPVRSNIYI